MEHADSYDDFLKESIAQLSTDYEDGRRIGGFPELQRITFKTNWKRSADGHVVIYHMEGRLQRERS